MACKGVLIIEDDMDIRQHVVEALRMEDYTTYEAANGQEGLDVLCDLPSDQLPACIILDMMMPIMDGRTFIHRIENDYKERLGGIHIIVATAKGSPLRPDSFPRQVRRLQKPFNLDELYEAVETYCK